MTPVIRSLPHRRFLAVLLGIGLLAGGSAVAQSGTSAKSAEALRAVFREATARASQSTVMLRSEEKGNDRRVALGTIVSADGFILTKASEVMGESHLFASIPSGTTTRRFDAKVVGYSAQHDLAMLKIDATGLTPITFADTRPPAGTDVEDRGFGRGSRGGRRGGAGGGGGGGGRGFGSRGSLPTPTTAPAPPQGAIAVEVGEWVASVNAAATLGNAPSTLLQEPFAVGVISLTRRPVPFRSGSLGIRFEAPEAETQPATRPGRGFRFPPPTPPTPTPATPPATRPSPSSEAAPAPLGVKIVQVFPESPAEKAGIKVDDIITAINGSTVHNGEELREMVTRYRPGDAVTVTVSRDDKTLTMKATLAVTNLDLLGNPLASLTSGPTNLRSTDFPAVFQHDTVLTPADCGGPLVDIDGHVIGINIARAGRTETYALPADLIIPLIEPMKSGKLAPVNANTPATRPSERPLSPNRGN